MANGLDLSRARFLVTGGAGFIGSCFVRYLRRTHPESRVAVLDKLTYAGNLANLESVKDDPGYRFILGDICEPETVREAMAGCDVVVNFAAETHVDRSIGGAQDFILTDTVGVCVLLEEARRSKVLRFVQVSTDEVYGEIMGEAATEDAPLRARNPYAASKIGGDRLAYAYYATHGVPAIVTRCSNNYGSFQYPEKLIPLFVTNALDGEALPLYGDGLQRRDWLYVTDHASAIEFILAHGVAGQAYNVPGGNEMTNRQVVEALLDKLGKPWSLVKTVEDRSGHDRRYAMDGSRLAALGWQPEVSFEDGLAETIAWYRSNEPWWRKAKSGDWDAYYERQYGARLASAANASR
jgi:dTDP-glucose 4,6-dehydratase